MKGIVRDKNRTSRVVNLRENGLGSCGPRAFKVDKRLKFVSSLAERKHYFSTMGMRVGESAARRNLREKIRAFHQAVRPSNDTHE